MSYMHPGADQSSTPISVIVFHEPSYPHLYTETTLARLIPGEFQVADAAELATKLARGCRTLISFHGPYFPKESWNAILNFLEAGGNLVVFGGMPFTRPIRSDGSAEPEQQTYTDQLYLGPFFQLDLASTDLQFVASDNAAFLADCSLFLAEDGKNDTFWSCYPKLCQV